MMVRQGHRRRSRESSRQRRKQRRHSREQLFQTGQGQPQQQMPITMYEAQNEITRTRPRGSSSSGSSSTSSTDSSLLNISNEGPKRFAFRSFFSNLADRKQQRRVHKQRKARFLRFGGSSSSSLSSELAYGKGYIDWRRSRDFEPEGERLESARPPKPSRAQTDEEIIELGRRFAEIARKQNEADLRAAGKHRPSALVGAAAAINGLRRKRQTQQRGISSSRRDRDSSADGSEWESASEDESSSEDDALAYGSALDLPNEPGRTTNVNISSQEVQNIYLEDKDRQKSSIVDPLLFGPINSLRGLVTPLGLRKSKTNRTEPSDAPSEGYNNHPMQQVFPVPTSDPTRFDAGRGSVTSAQQESRPAAVPIQQPRPMVPVSRSVFNTDDADSLHHRRSSSGIRRSAHGKALAEAAAVGIAGAAIGATLASGRRQDIDRFHEDFREREDKRREKDRDEAYERLVGYEDKDRQKREDAAKDKAARKKERKGKEVRRAARKEDGRAEIDAYRRVEDPNYPPSQGPIDPFQFQVADDAFRTPTYGVTPKRPLTPMVVTVDREPNFSPSGPDKDTKAEERMSRKDSYEREVKEAENVYEHTKHSTAPIEAAAIAAAVAAVATEKRRGRSRSRGADETSRNRSDHDHPQRDFIQEEADRYYREQMVARQTAKDHTQHVSPDRSVVDKWQDQQEPEVVEIVTPPEQADQPKKKSPYDAPDADVRIDHELYPEDLVRFRVSHVQLESEPSTQHFIYKSRDPSAERERPMLNLIRPTPEPSPMPERQKMMETSADERGEPQKQTEVQTAEPGAEVAIGPRGEIIQDIPSPTTPKNVSWGRNETRHYVVESDDSSGPKVVVPAETTRSRPGKKKSGGGWGVIASAVAGIAGASSPSDPVKDQSETSRSKKFQESPKDRNDAAISDGDMDRPPVPGPKPSSPRASAMPGGFAEDPEFTAAVAAGLQDSGFDPNIVVDNAKYHRRDSPPGSNEPSDFLPPLAETATDLGANNTEDSIRSKGRGFVIGEVPDVSANQHDLPARDGQAKAKAWHDDEVVESLTSKSSESDQTTAVGESGSSVSRRRRPKKQDKPVIVQDDASSMVTVPFDAEDNIRRGVSKSVDEEDFKARESDRKHSKSDSIATNASGIASTVAEPPSSVRVMDDYSTVGSGVSTAEEYETPTKKSKKKKRAKRDSTVRDSVPDEVDSPTAMTESFSDIRAMTESSYSDVQSETHLPPEDEQGQQQPRAPGGFPEDGPPDESEPPDKGRDPYEFLEREIDSGVSNPARYEEQRFDLKKHEEEEDAKSSASATSPSSRKEKKASSGPGLFDRLKASVGLVDEKDLTLEKPDGQKDHFLDNADTLGAGVGSASAVTTLLSQMSRQKATDTPSEDREARSLPISPEIERQPSPSERSDFVDPEIVQREIRPAIDPQYGDFLPLPPSTPGSPITEIDDLPPLPDSRPDTPEHERQLLRERERDLQLQLRERELRNKPSHTRKRSAIETPFKAKSPSQSAVPLQFRIRSTTPGSRRTSAVVSPVTTPTAEVPITSSSTIHRRASRPISWDSTKEPKPLFLLQKKHESDPTPEPSVGSPGTPARTDGGEVFEAPQESSPSSQRSTIPPSHISSPAASLYSEAAHVEPQGLSTAEIVDQAHGEVLATPTSSVDDVQSTSAVAPSSPIIPLRGEIQTIDEVLAAADTTEASRPVTEIHTEAETNGPAEPIYDGFTPGTPVAAAATTVSNQGSPDLPQWSQTRDADVSSDRPESFDAMSKDRSSYLLYSSSAPSQATAEAPSDTSPETVPSVRPTLFDVVESLHDASKGDSAVADEQVTSTLPHGDGDKDETIKATSSKEHSEDKDLDNEQAAVPDSITASPPPHEEVESEVRSDEEAVLPRLPENVDDLPIGDHPESVESPETKKPKESQEYLQQVIEAPILEELTPTTATKSQVSELAPVEMPADLTQQGKQNMPSTESPAAATIQGENPEPEITGPSSTSLFEDQQPATIPAEELAHEAQSPDSTKATPADSQPDQDNTETLVSGATTSDDDPGQKKGYLPSALSMLPAIGSLFSRGEQRKEVSEPGSERNQLPSDTSESPQSPGVAFHPAEKLDLERDTDSSQVAHEREEAAASPHDQSIAKSDEADLPPVAGEAQSDSRIMSGEQLHPLHADPHQDPLQGSSAAGTAADDAAQPPVAEEKDVIADLIPSTTGHALERGLAEEPKLSDEHHAPPAEERDENLDDHRSREALKTEQEAPTTVEDYAIDQSIPVDIGVQSQQPEIPDATAMAIQPIEAITEDEWSTPVKAKKGKKGKKGRQSSQVVSIDDLANITEPPEDVAVPEGDSVPKQTEPVPQVEQFSGATQAEASRVTEENPPELEPVAQSATGKKKSKKDKKKRKSVSFAEPARDESPLGAPEAGEDITGAGLTDEPTTISESQPGLETVADSFPRELPAGADQAPSQPTEPQTNAATDILNEPLGQSDASVAPQESLRSEQGNKEDLASKILSSESSQENAQLETDLTKASTQFDDTQEDQPTSVGEPLVTTKTEVEEPTSHALPTPSAEEVPLPSKKSKKKLKKKQKSLSFDLSSGSSTPEYELSSDATMPEGSEHQASLITSQEELVPIEGMSNTTLVVQPEQASTSRQEAQGDDPTGLLTKVSEDGEEEERTSQAPATHPLAMTDETKNEEWSRSPSRETGMSLDLQSPTPQDDDQTHLATDQEPLSEERSVDITAGPTQPTSEEESTAQAEVIEPSAAIPSQRQYESLPDDQGGDQELQPAPEIEAYEEPSIKAVDEPSSLDNPPTEPEYSFSTAKSKKNKKKKKKRASQSVFEDSVADTSEDVSAQASGTQTPSQDQQISSQMEESGDRGITTATPTQPAEHRQETEALTKVTHEESASDELKEDLQEKQPKMIEGLHHASGDLASEQDIVRPEPEFESKDLDTYSSHEQPMTQQVESFETSDETSDELQGQVESSEAIPTAEHALLEGTAESATTPNEVEILEDFALPVASGKKSKKDRRKEKKKKRASQIQDAEDQDSVFATPPEEPQPMQTPLTWETIPRAEYELTSMVDPDASSIPDQSSLEPIVQESEREAEPTVQAEEPMISEQLPVSTSLPEQPERPIEPEVEPEPVIRHDESETLGPSLNETSEFFSDPAAATAISPRESMPTEQPSAYAPIPEGGQDFEPAIEVEKPEMMELSSTEVPEVTADRESEAAGKSDAATLMEQPSEVAFDSVTRSQELKTIEQPPLEDNAPEQPSEPATESLAQDVGSISAGAEQSSDVVPQGLTRKMSKKEKRRSKKAAAAALAEPEPATTADDNVVPEPLDVGDNSVGISPTEPIESSVDMTAQPQPAQAESTAHAIGSSSLDVPSEDISNQHVEPLQEDSGVRQDSQILQPEGFAEAELGQSTAGPVSSDVKDVIPEKESIFPPQSLEDVVWAAQQEASNSQADLAAPHAETVEPEEAPVHEVPTEEPTPQLVKKTSGWDLIAAAVAGPVAEEAASKSTKAESFAPKDDDNDFFPVQRKLSKKEKRKKRKSDSQAASEAGSGIQTTATEDVDARSLAEDVTPEPPHPVTAEIIESSLPESPAPAMGEMPGLSKKKSKKDKKKRKSTSSQLGSEPASGTQTPAIQEAEMRNEFVDSHAPQETDRPVTDFAVTKDVVIETPAAERLDEWLTEKVENKIEQPIAQGDSEPTSGFQTPAGTQDSWADAVETPPRQDLDISEGPQVRETNPDTEPSLDMLQPSVYVPPETSVPSTSKNDIWDDEDFFKPQGTEETRTLERDSMDTLKPSYETNVTPEIKPEVNDDVTPAVSGSGVDYEANAEHITQQQPDQHDGPVLESETAITPSRDFAASYLENPVHEAQETDQPRLPSIPQADLGFDFGFDAPGTAAFHAPEKDMTTSIPESQPLASHDEQLTEEQPKRPELVADPILEITPEREIAASYLESQPRTLENVAPTITETKLEDTTPDLTPRKELAASYLETQSAAKDNRPQIEMTPENPKSTSGLGPRRSVRELAARMERRSGESTKSDRLDAPREPKGEEEGDSNEEEKAASAGAHGGGVAWLARKFGGASKNSKYVDQETPSKDDDLSEDPSLWEASEPKTLDGGRLYPDSANVADQAEEVKEMASSSEERASLGARPVLEHPEDHLETSNDSPESPVAGRDIHTEPDRPRSLNDEDFALHDAQKQSTSITEPASDFMRDLDELDTSEPTQEHQTAQSADVDEHADHLSPSSEPHSPTRMISPIHDILHSGRTSIHSLPPVEEEPREDIKKEFQPEPALHPRAFPLTKDADRDSGFMTDSPHPMRHSFEGQRDSGVHLRDSGHSDNRLSPVPVRRMQSHRESRRLGLLPNDEVGTRLSWSSADSREHRTPSPNRRISKRSPLGDEAQRLSRYNLPSQRAKTPELATPETHQLRHSRYGDLGHVGGWTPQASGHAEEQRSVSEAVSRVTSPPVAGERRSISNTSSRVRRTPEPLNLRPWSPNSARSSGTNTPPLRRETRISGDLRGVSNSQQLSHSHTRNPSLSKEVQVLSKDEAALEHRASTYTTTPVANEGRVRAAKDMTEVYDGIGEGRIGSPRSPTRPHSMRRRQSMQVLELESRVEQLLAENRQLTDAKVQAETNVNQRAAGTIAERDALIESLRSQLEEFKREVGRLREVNDGLNSANAQLALQHNEKYTQLEIEHTSISQELESLRSNHAEYTQELQEKDAEIQQLRDQLESTKEQVRLLQQQILASKPPDADFLRLKDEDHFDHRCQQLCAHAQQWVLRFSKFSDMRACRLTNEINDEKIIDRLDNSVLDGTDVDDYLRDRVRRRDIFMSMTMNMIWEYVFTRYLFGMDREQRQKLKSLEKLLTDVGPPHAVRQWRAVTLTLLSRRPAFGDQRNEDTEAVVQAILQTLSMILPPPSNMENQIQSQLRRVVRESVDLSVEMRTQRAEYMMLPPLQPEYDANGDLSDTVTFNASLMNERSGSSTTNDEYEAQGAIVRFVLFPLVVKKGDDNGLGDDEIVVCPAQVLVARARGSSIRMVTPSTDGGGTLLSREATPYSQASKSGAVNMPMSPESPSGRLAQRQDQTQAAQPVGDTYMEGAI